MTHFTVLAVANDMDDLHNKMLPFYEYGCSTETDTAARNAGYVEFKNVEEECRKDYETATSKMVRLPDGELAYAWDRQFKLPNESDSLFATPKYAYPDGLQPEDVPLKEKYPDFKDFITKYHGYEYYEDLGYGYWHNPNARWDYYRPLAAKEYFNDPAMLTQPDHFGFQSTYLNTFDSQSEFDKYVQEYEEAEELAEFLGLTLREFLDIPLHPDKDGGIDRLFFGEYYDDGGILTFFVPHGATALEHAYNACKQPITYAFVDEAGVWHSKGKAGWWGSESDPNSDYAQEWQEFVDRVKDQDLTLYVMDCHI